MSIYLNMIILQINNVIMKQLIKYLFIGTLLISCSPKYTELNDQGFGGGFQSFKKTDSYSKSKLEKFNNQKVENEKQFSENIGIESENLQSVNHEVSRYTSLKNQKVNHKSQSLFQFKKRAIQNPKLSNIIEKLTFKSKTQKKNDILSKVLTLMFIVFSVLLIIAACLLMLSLVLFFSRSWEMALLLFLYGYYVGIASLTIGFITFILWLINLISG